MLSLAKASCRFLIRRLNFVVIQGGSLLFIFIVFVGSIVLMPLLKRSKKCNNFSSRVASSVRVDQCMLFKYRPRDALGDGRLCWMVINFVLSCCRLLCFAANDTVKVQRESNVLVGNSILPY